MLRNPSPASSNNSVAGAAAMTRCSSEFQETAGKNTQSSQPKRSASSNLETSQQATERAKRTRHQVLQRLEQATGFTGETISSKKAKIEIHNQEQIFNQISHYNQTRQLESNNVRSLISNSAQSASEEELVFHLDEASQILDQKAWLVKALEGDPKNADSYFHLANELSPGEKITVSLNKKDKQVDQIFLYTKALILKPVYPEALHHLGLALGSHYLILELNNKRYIFSQKSCIAKALKQDPENPIIFRDLGNALKPDEKIKLVIQGNEFEYDKKSCYAKALKFSPGMKECFRDLADLLGPDEIIKINGELLNKDACIRRAK